jgi:predicted permease
MLKFIFLAFLLYLFYKFIRIVFFIYKSKKAMEKEINKRRSQNTVEEAEYEILDDDK